MFKEKTYNKNNCKNSDFKYNYKCQCYTHEYIGIARIVKSQPYPKQPSFSWSF
ncbi:hypothetical protein [Clostridium sulfidigenes]|uniref:hypothetical protein n=1 Tax=Clostridium sulfidigenes TaxID=318464 RepID=UPI003F8953EE